MTAQPLAMMTSRETAEVFSGPRGTVKYAVEAIKSEGEPGQLVLWPGDRIHSRGRRVRGRRYLGRRVDPAVSLGAAVMGLFAWPTLWVYVLAQVVAGVAAGVSFLSLNPDDK